MNKIIFNLLHKSLHIIIIKFKIVLIMISNLLKVSDEQEKILFIKIYYLKVIKFTIYFTRDFVKITQSVN